FDFKSDQVMLRNNAREYLAEKCTTQFVRTMFDDQAGYSKEMWKELADLGWLGLTFAEENEGLGLGMVELSLVLGEMGRAVFPARTSDKPDGITLFAVDTKTKGVELSPMTNIDLTSKASEVRLNNVMVPEENIIGDVDGGWPVLKDVLQRAAVGASAEMLGAA